MAGSFQEHTLFRECYVGVGPWNVDIRSDSFSNDDKEQEMTMW